VYLFDHVLLVRNKLAELQDSHIADAILVDLENLDGHRLAPKPSYKMRHRPVAQPVAGEVHLARGGLPCCKPSLQLMAKSRNVLILNALIALTLSKQDARPAVPSARAIAADKGG
jgi:hypothetical protein